MRMMNQSCSRGSSEAVNNHTVLKRVERCPRLRSESVILYGRTKVFWRKGCMIPVNQLSAFCCDQIFSGVIHMMVPSRVHLIWISSASSILVGKKGRAVLSERVPVMVQSERFWGMSDLIGPDTFHWIFTQGNSTRYSASRMPVDRGRAYDHPR